MIYKSSILAVISSMATAAIVMCSVSSVSAQEKTSYVGPSIGFGSGDAVYGVNAKFKVADDISVRPFIQFGNRSAGSVNATLTLYGASASYDFTLPQSEFKPYAGVGYIGATASVSVPGANFSGSSSGIYFEVGSDYNISDTIALNANYKFRDGGYLSVGGAYRF
jgi:Outer membrane protein beta-barrel domain